MRPQDTAAGFEPVCWSRDAKGRTVYRLSGPDCLERRVLFQRVAHTHEPDFAEIVGPPLPYAPDGWFPQTAAAIVNARNVTMPHYERVRAAHAQHRASKWERAA